MYWGEYIAIAWGVDQHAKFSSLLGVFTEVEVERLSLSTCLRSIGCLLPHIEGVNQGTLAHICASHYQNFLGAWVFIIEFVVILFNSFDEAVNVPLVQLVDEFEAIFLHISGLEVVGPQRCVLRMVLKRTFLVELH